MREYEHQKEIVGQYWMRVSVWGRKDWICTHAKRLSQGTISVGSSSITSAISQNWCNDFHCLFVTAPICPEALQPVSKFPPIERLSANVSNKIVFEEADRHRSCHEERTGSRECGSHKHIGMFGIFSRPRLSLASLLTERKREIKENCTHTIEREREKSRK